MTAKRYTLNTPDVVFERLDGEVMAIHLASGCYYNLNSTAELLWTFALAGWTASETAARLADAPGLSPAAITAFLATLAAEDLVAERGATPRDDLPGLVLPPDLAAPEIEKCTDMQELMLVDPIHEVTQAAWSRVAPPVA